MNKHFSKTKADDTAVGGGGWKLQASRIKRLPRLWQHQQGGLSAVVNSRADTLKLLEVD